MESAAIVCALCGGQTTRGHIARDGDWVAHAELPKAREGWEPTDTRAHAARVAKAIFTGDPTPRAFYHRCDSCGYVMCFARPPEQV